MYRLKLNHHFDSAHNLLDYEGACANLHGHRWEVEIIILVPHLRAENNNMVIDFKKLKGIINNLDHAYLNEKVDFNPTAENIVQYLHMMISMELSKLYKDFKLEVELWESPEASVKYL